MWNVVRFPLSMLSIRVKPFWVLTAFPSRLLSDRESLAEAPAAAGIPLKQQSWGVTASSRPSMELHAGFPRMGVLLLFSPPFPVVSPLPTMGQEKRQEKS